MAVMSAAAEGCEVRRRNAWRYYVRGVFFGDGRCPARVPMEADQEQAGLSPGVWMGRGLAVSGPVHVEAAPRAAR